MDAARLTQASRAYRNDLRKELQAIWNRNKHHYNAMVDGGLVRLNNDEPFVADGDLYIAVQRLEAARGKFDALAHMARDWQSEVSMRLRRDVFDRLVDHERAYGKLSKIATIDLCWTGADCFRDIAWPRCRECLLPFETMLQGMRSAGLWVSRIEDGAEVCGACWLDENYRGDHAAMIAHVLTHDAAGDWLPRAARAGLLRRPNDASIVFDQTCLSLWQSAGLFELVRLHRLSLLDAAIGVGTMAAAILAAARVRLKEIADARAAATDARRRVWLDERRGNPILTRTSRGSDSVGLRAN